MEKTNVRLFLKAIQCQNCKKYLYAPVRGCTSCQCSFCPECATSTCPKCNNNKTIMRCIATDRLLDDLPILCPHDSCQFEDKSERLRQHVELCVSKLKLCPLRVYKRCAWAGSSLEHVIKHCERNHPEKIFALAEKQLKFVDFKTQFSHILKCDVWIMFNVYEELFRFYYTVDYANGCVIFIVCYGGESGNEKKFSFEVIFGNRLKYKAKCERINGNEQDFEHFIVEDMKVLQKFCTGNDLDFNVKISCD